MVPSPLTLNKKQVAELKRLITERGKTVLMIGDAGRGSRDYSGPAGVLAELGMRVVEHPETVADAVAVAPGTGDPLVDGIAGRICGNGVSLVNGQPSPRYLHGSAAIDDPDAKVLGRWEKSGRPGLAIKRFAGGGRLIYSAYSDGLSPRLLHNAAKEAGIRPHSEPGNAVFVGYGVAGAHRLAAPVQVELPVDADIFDPATGKPLGTGRFWTPELAPGDSAAVLWLPRER